MTVFELLAELRSRNVRVWADGDRLRVGGARGSLTPDLREELTRHKAEILDVLQSSGPGDDDGAPILAVDRQAEVPLSFAQQRLWFLEQLEPGNPTYHLGSALWLDGNLDVEALRQSLETIVRRHDSLRTRFAVRDGRPFQVVAPELPLPFEVEDLRNLASAERAEQVARLGEREARAPFDLARGPLLRFRLLRLDDDKHVFLYTLHHVIADAWSRGLLRRELTILYSAFAGGRPAALPDPPVQYPDYAAWQRERLSGARLERQLGYWKTQLADPPVLHLPTDRPRPAVQTSNGAHVDFTLPPALGEAMQALCRAEGVTPAMLLLAAYQVLLGRYSGQTDIAVGSPIANRPRPELEELIGFFANTLVLRTKLDGDPTFRELLQHVRRISLDAYERQDVPFETLVEVLRPERDPSRSPLFQAVFAMQNVPRAGLDLPGLVISDAKTTLSVARADVELHCTERPTGVTGRLIYNTDLFDAATIERMAVHFRRLLEAFVADPLVRVRDVSMIPDDERRTVLVEWNRTAQPYPADACLQELIEARADEAPAAVALVHGERSVTYAELDERANRLAHALRGRGVGPDTLVGLCARRSPELVVGLLGILKAGGAYVPLDPDYPARRLAFMLADSGARILITQTELLDVLPPHEAEILCLDRDWPAIGAMPATRPPRTVTPDHLAYMIYTSGSTGQPKGALLPHRGLCSLSHEQARAFSVGPESRVLQFSSLSFDACTFEIVMALPKGATLVLGDRDELLPGPDLVAFLRRHRVSIVTMPPSALAALPEDELPDLRTITVAGEACTADLVSRWAPGRRFFNLYGPTETTIWATMAELRADRDAHIGRPIGNVEVYVLDERFRPVPTGVPGELCVAGVGLARGYHARPALTAERFVPNPFAEARGARMYRTGDLVRFRRDGTIEFLGRIDTQVKLRGFRIEPGEIAAALSDHERVDDAVVVVREDGGERRLVAYVATGRDDVGLAAELRAYLAERLPRYMVPAAIVTLAALPISPNGKVDRRALPAPDASRLGQAGYVEPRTLVEQSLADVWSEVLAVEQVGVHDDFFDLGGHSLLATQVVSRIREIFEVELPVRALFDAPTIAGVADRITQCRDQSLPAPPITAVPRDGAVPLSFAQQRMMILDRLGAGAAYNVRMALRLSGPLDEAALVKSLQAIVDRHEVLRTGYAWHHGEPVQEIVDALELPLERVDLSDQPVSERDEALERRAAGEAERPFDLARPPLLRCVLVRLGADEHVLLVIMHHIATDGWSMGIFQRELSMHYERLASGAATVEAAGGANPALQYADYAAWQREWLQEERLETQLDYWRGRLAGAPPVLELPIDHPRPPVPSGHGRRVRFAFSQELSAGLDALARTHGASAFMTLLALFDVLLMRITGQRDVVVGTPVAGRDRRELEEIVGFFVNTLVVRTDMTDDPSFADLLGRVRAVTLDGLDHQALPFEQLVDALQPQRDLTTSPLFQVLFTLQNAPQAPPELVGLNIAPHPMKGVTAKFDLSLSMTSYGGRWLGNFEYRAELFEPDTVERIVRCFEQLAKGVVADPEGRVSAIPLLDEAERRLVMETWNDTSVEFPITECLHETFERRVAEAADSVALTFNERSITYGELNARANQLAHRLIACGVGPDALVALSMERGPDMLVGILGTLKAGGAYVPIDPANPVDRIALILYDTAVPVLVTERGVLDVLPDQGAAPDRTIICLDDDPALDGESTGNPGRIASPDDLAYVIFTSGSTGKPKGVLVAHRHVARLFSATDAWFGFDASDVWTLFHSFAFDFSVWEIWGALLYGGRLVIVPHDVSRAPDEFHRLLCRERVTVLNQTPSAFRQLMRVDEQLGHEGDLALRLIIFGGEALDLQGLRPWFERHGDEKPQLVNMYGITETTVHVTYRPLAMRDLDSVPGSMIGRPIPDLQVYILDDQRRPAPIGVPGELYVGGAGVTRGYLNRDALTAERFIDDPFSSAVGARLYRTGDVGRLLPKGDIEYRGRNDAQVKVRGYRIELAEVEAALRTHPSVAEAVASVREDEPGERELVAYVVVEPNATAPLPEELRRHVRGTLPDSMVPSAFVALESLPLTVNGKVDRAALPAPFTERRPDVGLVAPSSEIESQIAEIWRDVLGVEHVGVRDNFFDLGGHSLRLIKVYDRMVETLGCTVTITELFQHPTIEAIARHLAGDAPAARRATTRVRRRRASSGGAEPIAIIAMAGRFPGAPDVERFWSNLRAGEESVHFFTDDELRAAGVPEALLRRPDFVKARAVLDGGDEFDAWYFGYSPREAELIDPQQRIFLECAVEALERAGYDPRQYDGAVGVYAGVSASAYLRNLQSHPELLSTVSPVQVTASTDKDFLPTRVSYKLNLRGPSMTVQTACSTSLVAVHEACRSLVDGECDIALAGGVSFSVPAIIGHIYQAGGIASPDGHCRAFDARAQGCLAGDGAGIVVLKRLDEALRDGDHVHAVIRGTAINNDGALKVGYTAPSVDGQAEVIALAQASAGVEPSTITYVEAHGTGTALGDPIEVAALQKVFGDRTTRKQLCALGSLKSNMGHLDAAAGVAGLIKTVLAMEHGEIPPSLHFETPNPEIDFDRSAFFVNTALRPWVTEDGTPRRAGVSSFGLGGTNAHAVLEESPKRPASGPSRGAQVLVLSAKTETALETMTSNLASHLRDHPGVNLADAAHTLQVGRSELEHRRAVACGSTAEAIDALEGRAPARRWTRHVAAGTRPVVFLFPGQGAQYVNMGRGLYETERVYRETVDACLEDLAPHMDVELRSVLYPEAGADLEAASAQLTRTSVAQPALFVTEYALAQLWRSWGIEPAAMIGHSIGEYTAACVSGVLERHDALRLVAMRGRLMGQMPEGVMLSVPLDEDCVRGQLDGAENVWLSVLNAPSMCVVSGTSTSIAELETKLASEGVEARRLHTSHAFHSGLMDGAVTPFVEAVRGVAMGAPQIPYASNVTGAWMTAETLADPSYWGRHIREAVRFGDGLELLLSDPNQVLVEVGPGQVLGTLARQQSGFGTDRVVVPSLRRPQSDEDDGRFLAGAVGQLWTGGVSIDWSRYRSEETRRRVTLPTYPFERERYWIERRAPQPAVTRADLADWFYAPSWWSSAPPRPVAAPGRRCLVFADDSSFARELVAKLEGAGRQVTVVDVGDAYRRVSRDRFTIDPTSREHYEQLCVELSRDEHAPDEIVHLWLCSPEAAPSHAGRAVDLGFHAIIDLVRAVLGVDVAGNIPIAVVTNGVHAVADDDAVEPDRATILGPCRVVGTELPKLACRNIDVSVADVAGDRAAVIDQLCNELLSAADETVVAYRRGRRWVESFSPMRLPELDDAPAMRLRPGGTYLITGGLGGIGLTLAECLARTVNARVVLVGRTGLPDRAQWAAHLEGHDGTDDVSQRILAIEAMERAGGEVMVAAADVCDFDGMQSVVEAVAQRFGPIHGVIHAAGVGAGRMIELLERDEANTVMAPKIAGCRVLERLFGERALDFMLLCSSLASVQGMKGQVAYSAANAYLDAFARRFGSETGTFTVSIDWTRWREVGMAVRGAEQFGFSNERGITNEEGVEVFQRILDRCTEPRVLVSETDLRQRLTGAHRSRQAGSDSAAEARAGRRAPAAHARPSLGTDFVEPGTASETALAEVWQELLGIDRIGAQDSFFDLGGHSLLATQVISRIRNIFGIGVSLAELYEASTVDALARMVESRVLEEIDQLSDEEAAKMLAMMEERGSDDALEA